MLDDTAVLLPRSGQKTGHVFEGHQRNVEGVTEAHEARSLHRSVDVQDSGQVVRLVGDNADALAREASESNHEVSCIFGVDLEEDLVVDHRVNQGLDVVGLVRISGNERVETLFFAIWIVVRVFVRCILEVVAR